MKPVACTARRNVSALIRAAAVCGTMSVLMVGACIKNIPRPPDDLDDGGVDADEMDGQGGIGGLGGVGGVPLVDASPDAAPDVRRPEPDTSVPDVAPPPADVALPTCGGNGQACCPGNACRNNGCCASGHCAANGTACRSDATCLNGSCGGCGGLGPAGSSQFCCADRVCTATKTFCSGAGVGFCQACGGAGQPCCANSYCEGASVCDPAMMAPTGMCVPCGGKGAACCEGQQACTMSNGTCAGGKCP